MLTIPANLIQQVKEGKVVLLLGAGASREAVNDGGKNPPTGAQLAYLLSENFLGGQFSELPLDQVSELAISECGSLVVVQEYIRALLEPFRPTDAHRLLASFRWEGLATTNYDRLIETAYEGAHNPTQIAQPFIEDGDRIHDKMRNPNSVKLLKLHGCITRTANTECPLILTVDQYVQYRKGRGRLFSQLFDWAIERPMVFIGHSLRDPDLRALINELISTSGEARPRYFAVSPDTDPIQSRFWETKKVTCIDASFSAFMTALDSQISSSFRGLAVDYSTATHPIEERFHQRDSKLSDRCKQFLDVEVDYVKECTRGLSIDPKQFYRGFDGGWSAIEQDLDVKRRVVDDILSDLVLEEPRETPNGTTIALVKAHAGAGKSIFLKRMAWDSAHHYGKLCLFLKPHGTIDLEALKEIQDLCKERILLFIDDAADHRRELRQLAGAPGPEFRYLTIITAERTNQWNMVDEEIKAVISCSYDLPYLSEKEIDQLLGLLEKHKALGTLQKLSKVDQQDAFRERAGRQLLVALHEATFGKPFEEIVVDEYRGISSDEARDIYLSICVLNRLGVDVRAGIVSRIHSVTFEDFKARLFLPLEKVVQTRLDPVIRDYMYSARHPHIAEIVFINVLIGQEERFGAFIRCLKALNIDFNTDLAAFRQMIRANGLLELFPNPELIRAIFSEAQLLARQDAFVFQQMAIFEMHHESGSILKAEELLRKAEYIKPEWHSIRHSLAEVELKLAEQAHTTLQREKHLEKAERIASSLIGRKSVDSHPYHTIFKAVFVRLKNAIAEGDGNLSSTVQDLVVKLEKHLAAALQRFPNDSYLLDAESRFATLLADSERALKALEQAFEANRRNSWFAIRLSRAYRVKEHHDRAREVLRKALDANQNSHELHYAYAKLILDSVDPNSDELIYHLRRSYSPGDPNYEAQLLHARQLFLCGQLEEAKAVFQGLGQIRRSPECINEIRYRDDSVYRGVISRQEYSHLWVRRDGTSDFIFAHRSNVDEKLWNDLRRDTRVTFRIGFTLKGPSVYEIWI